MDGLLVTAASAAIATFLLSGLFSSRRKGTLPGVRSVRRMARSRLRFLQEKRSSGESEVPVMLDIVTLGLGAGLSFDASLELYCERYQGRLARSLDRVLLAWRLGALSRSEALKQAAKTADAPSLVEVADVVEEALELGLPLADTLTRKADAIRAARRSLLEERIERVPVKMLIPLGTLIVPAMLLAILGPLLGAVLQVG